jgi:hypothetical protein
LILVNITTIECYINHLLPNGDVSDIEIDTFRMNIGRVSSFHKDLCALRLLDAEHGSTQELIDRILETGNAIKNTLELLPSLEQLQSLELSCSKDTFLEILIMSVKGSSLSHQHDFF